jgi:hypothetical protein
MNRNFSADFFKTIFKVGLQKVCKKNPVSNFSAYKLQSLHMAIFRKQPRALIDSAYKYKIMKLNQILDPQSLPTTEKAKLKTLLSDSDDE